MIDLNDLPLDLLIALQGLITDKSEEGLGVAQQRAAEAGFSLVRGERIEIQRAEHSRPIQTEEAPEGIEAKHLAFDSSTAPHVLVHPVMCSGSEPTPEASRDS